jgi:IS30 family transposase
MNYEQLTEKKIVEIDILLKQGLLMRKIAKILGISRYKAGIYMKRKIDIN